MIDVGVSAALTVAALIALAGLHYSGPVALAVVGCVGVTTTVAYRRAAPVAATLASMTALPVYQRITHDPLGTFIAAALVLTSYMLGRTSSLARRVVVCTLAYAFPAAAVASGSGGALLGPPGAWIPFALLPFVVGVLVARRARLTNELARALDALAREHEARAAQAILDERSRIARELHDVVAHGVSVMVIQAGAARMVASTDPVAARQALGVVEDSGRDAIGELRRLMGVLRRDDELAAADAGLARLGALVARVQAAGLETTLHVDAPRPELPPALDLVAYRVVQEALTNAVKHGGAGATAEVHISFDDAAVELDVRNTPGVARGDAASNGAGRGLAGMRERIALYDGRLDTFTDADGAFRVHARLPLGRVAPLEHARPRALGPSVPRPAGTSRYRARRFDVAVAAVWLVALEAEVALSSHLSGPRWANALAVAAMTVAAVWRRRAPLLFLAFVGLLAVPLGGGLTSTAHSTLTGAYVLTVPLFTVAAWSTKRRSIVGLVVWVGGASVGMVLWHSPVGGWLGAALMGCVVWTAGRITRSQRDLAARLRAASKRLTAERAAREELAVTQERARIAHDLHALVSHGVVAMIIQAEAARAMVEHQPARAGAAAQTVEQAGRAALARMREILDVLRPDGAAAPLAPAGLVNDLDGVVA
jgi:signal transduction histidine kinase